MFMFENHTYVHVVNLDRRNCAMLLRAGLGAKDGWGSSAAHASYRVM